MNHPLFGKSVLITGAGGFIGSHLTETLVKSGARVRALVKYSSTGSWGFLDSLPKNVKSEIEVIGGDIQDPYCCEKVVAGQEVVFHLAALIGIPYSYRAPASYVDVNIKGTQNLLQACLAPSGKGGVRFVHTSTSETYGTARFVPITEEHPLQGQSPYSASKIAADKIAESYALAFGLPVVTVRPFNTYGPRQSARAIIPTIISQTLSGASEIKLGSLRPERDFTYVSDTALGFIAAASSSFTKGEAVNLGFGTAITIGDLAKKIFSLVGHSPKIITDPERERPDTSEVWKLVSDNSKAKAQLKWAPIMDLDLGLKSTIEYIRKNLDRYRADTFSV